MLRPRRLFVSAAAALTLALGVSGCADDNVAIQVGNKTISESDLTDELKVLADKDVAPMLLQAEPEQLAGELRGSYNRDFVGAVINQKVYTLLLMELLDNEDASITDKDLDTARRGLESEATQAGANLDTLPATVVDLLVENRAMNEKASTTFESEDDFNAALEETARSTEIKLGSRWGTFDVDKFLGNDPGAVTPPEGPVGAEVEAEEPQPLPGG